MKRRSMMVAMLLVHASVTAYSRRAVAQTDALPGIPASLYRANFAVPDAPAFEMLEVDPTTILRPTTVKELTAAVSGFTGSGTSLAIPRAFAIEIAPALLIGGKSLSLQKYNANAALYRLRVSAATSRPEGTSSPTQIALGLRVDLIDEADLRSNASYLRTSTAIADQIQLLYEGARERAGPPPAPIELTTEETDSILRLQAPLRELWENKKWNARVLEVAAGFRAGTADTLGRGLQAEEFGGWVTFGMGFGSWGQLLLGGKAVTVRDTLTSDFTAAGGAAGRLYAGTNRYKFFVEAGGNWRLGPDEWRLSGGGEAELIRGGWVSFSAGLASTSSRTDLRTNLAVKLGVAGL
jgi:hypothetical protein